MLTYPNNGKIPKWDKKLNKHTNKIVKKNLLHGLYPYNTINVRCKCSTFFMASLIAMQCILPLICAFYRGRTKRHMYEVHHCLLVWTIQLIKPAFFSENIKEIALYVTIGILTFLLVLNVGVIIYQRRKISGLRHNRRQTDDTQIPAQSQNYDNVISSEEVHVYTTLDTVK